MDLNLELCSAATQGDLHRLIQCITYGADINFIDPSGRTPVILAATYNHRQCVQELLKRGADPSDYTPNPTVRRLLQPCWFYQQSYCKYGDSCQYAHVDAWDDGGWTEPEEKVDSHICKFWLNGNCRYGMECLFRHSISENTLSAYINPSRPTINKNLSTNQNNQIGNSEFTQNFIGPPGIIPFRPEVGGTIPLNPEIPFRSEIGNVPVPLNPEIPLRSEIGNVPVPLNPEIPLRSDTGNVPVPLNPEIPDPSDIDEIIPDSDPENPQHPIKWGHMEEFPKILETWGESSISIISKNTFLVEIPPKNPDTFPYDLRALLVFFKIHENYPQIPASINILNENFPQKLKNSIAARVMAHVRENFVGKMDILGILFWIQTNMEKLMIDQEIDRMYKMKQQGIEIFAFSNDPSIGTGIFGKSENSGNSNSSEDSEDSEDLEENSEDSENSEENSPTPQGQDYGVQTAHRGTQLRCNNLILNNAALVECNLLNLVIACERCRRHVDVALTGNQQFTGTCVQCSTPFGLLFRPEMIHTNSSILGYIDKESATLFDVSPSGVVIVCAECNSQVTIKRADLSGSMNQVNCGECHKIIQVVIEGVQFLRIHNTGPSSINLEKMERRKKNKLQQQHLGLQRGQPLPKKGTCKHYLKSKRWLRFPCCGKAFACDICHDQNSDHESMWAKRMICGFCSVEQPFSDSKPCVNCGANHSVISSNKSHWEGGEGCRDRTKMSKKDNKKYRGMNKTKPKKKDG